MKVIHVLQVDTIVPYLPAGIANQSDFVAKHFSYIATPTRGGFTFAGSVQMSEPKGIFGIPVRLAPQGANALLPVSPILSGLDPMLDEGVLNISFPMVPYPSGATSLRISGKVTIWDELPEKFFDPNVVSSNNEAIETWSTPKEYPRGEDSVIKSAFGFTEGINVANMTMPTGTFLVHSPTISQMPIFKYAIDYIAELKPNQDFYYVSIPMEVKVSFTGIVIPIWDVVPTVAYPVPQLVGSQVVQDAAQWNDLIDAIRSCAPRTVQFRTINEILAELGVSGLDDGVSPVGVWYAKVLPEPITLNPSSGVGIQSETLAPNVVEQFDAVMFINDNPVPGDEFVMNIGLEGNAQVAHRMSNSEDTVLIELVTNEGILYTYNISETVEYTAVKVVLLSRGVLTKFD